MSELQAIGAAVAATAGELGSWAQVLHVEASHLRSAAAHAGQASRSAEGGGPAAHRAAVLLDRAAAALDQAAQHLVAGRSAAEQFVAAHVGGGGTAGGGGGGAAGLSADGGGADGSDSGAGGSGALSASQAKMAECAFGTPGGTAFFGADAADDRLLASHQSAFPGEHSLLVHGSPDSVGVCEAGQWYDATAAEFAEVVRRSGWSGQPIRLLACSTGADPEGFAQQLADELGVEVVAPNESVWIGIGGMAPEVSAPEDYQDPVDGTWKSRPTRPRTGSWVLFTPRPKAAT